MEARYMNRVQVYAENTSLKYPLSDFSDGVIDKDILIDMSLSISDGWEILYPDAYVTNLIRTPQYFFIAIENDAGPIAHLFVEEPIPFKMYTLTMHKEGAGFIVLGPGISRNFAYKQVREAVDGRCVMPNSMAAYFQLVVNGEEFPMPDVLNISTNYFIATTAETRKVGADTLSNVLCLKRNDSKLSSDLIKFGLTQATADSLPILTIAQVPPDSNGNFTLEFDSEEGSVSLITVNGKNGAGGSSTSGGAHADAIGFMIATSGDMHGCTDEYKRLLMNTQESDTGEGVIWELPLDCLFQGSSTSGGDGCGCTDPPKDDDCPKDCCPKTYPGVPRTSSTSSST